MSGERGAEIAVPWLAWLRSAAALRVIELPRPYESSDAQSAQDSFKLQRLGSLAAAFHSGSEPFGLVWLRATARGPVELLGLGRSVFPPSARAEPSPALADRLASIPWWTCLRGRFDGLTNAESAEADRRRAGPSVEDGLLSVWTDPFAVVVLAVPVSQDGLDAAVHDVARDITYAKQRAGSNPERAVEYERLSAWHRELRATETTGLWRVGVYTAGADRAAASAVAGLLMASLDLRDSAYVLTPAGAAGGVADVMEAAGSTFLAGSGLLGALTRTPASEVPGLRLVLQPEFDITPETQLDDQLAEPEAGAPSGVQVGAVLDRALRSVGALTVPLSSLNRHTFVCGATGGGKSQTVRHLLGEAARQGVPWLVLEPAKAEYARMTNRLAELLGDHHVIVVRPGDPDAIPAGLDPLRPVDGFPLQTHLDLVRALFLAAFDADEPFPQVLAAALTRAYEEQGWHIALGEAHHARHRTTRSAGEFLPRYPTLADLERVALQVVDEIGYGREVANNVRGFIKVRLGSLRLGTTGRFLEGGHPLDIGKFLSHNVVLELEDVGDDRDKGFLIGAVLIALTEHLRMAERRSELQVGRLRHLTVIEEAHRLLRRPHGREEGAAAQAVEMFAALLAEVRAYGEGLIVAEQIPAKLIPDVIKNTAVKLVHRLPAQDDRDAVGATMNLTDAQSAYLVTLRPGTAAAFTDGMDHPVLTRMPDGTAVEDAHLPVTNGPERIVSPESGRCGADYGLLGHPYRDFVRAARVLTDHTLLRMWIELSVTAHLVGRTRPEPSDEIRQTFLDIDPALRPVVLALAVDDAAATRTTAVSRYASPTHLAEHIHASVTPTLAGQPPCSALEPTWTAPPFQWDTVLTSLTRPNPATGRHPRSGEWEHLYGIRIPGATVDEQRATVQRWKDKLTDPELEHVLLFGHARPSVIETVVGTGALHPDWPADLAHTLAEVTSLRWPYTYLTRYHSTDEGL